MGSSNGNDITGRYLKIVAAGIGVGTVSGSRRDLVALDLVCWHTTCRVRPHDPSQTSTVGVESFMVRTGGDQRVLWCV
jgi:hypothetical protein